MTAKEKLIAETAVDRGMAQTYDVIEEEVAKITGIDIADVKKTLEYLSREGFLKQTATPAWNLAEGPKPADYYTWAWYEKGELWPPDVFAQHGDCGDAHLETEYAGDGKWRWKVLRKRQPTIEGSAGSVEDAMGEAANAAGCTPEKWMPIGKPTREL